MEAKRRRNKAYLGQKVYADSRLVCIIEGIIHEASNQRSLADYDLCQNPVHTQLVWP